MAGNDIWEVPCLDSFGSTVLGQFWKYRAWTVLEVPCLDSFGSTVYGQFWKCYRTGKYAVCRRNPASIILDVPTYHYVHGPLCPRPLCPRAAVPLAAISTDRHVHRQLFQQTAVFRDLRLCPQTRFVYGPMCQQTAMFTDRCVTDSYVHGPLCSRTTVSVDSYVH